MSTRPVRAAALCLPLVFVAFACSSSSDGARGAGSTPAPPVGSTPGLSPNDNGPSAAPSADGTVETRRATSLGLDAFTANGRIQPGGRPTVYWVEYGKTTAYGERTAPRSLGPRRAAHYEERWPAGSGLAGWGAGVEGFDLAPGVEDTTSYVRFSQPSSFDPNHEDGIGFIQLTSYLHVGTMQEEGIFNAVWGAGDPDVRDATVSVTLRGNDFRPNGAELSFWAQSDIDLQTQNDEAWRRANWAHTGSNLTDALTAGGWQTVDYVLTNDTNAWSYGGKSFAQERDNYQYWSLDETLRHLNCNLHHVLAFARLDAPPEGTIDYARFAIAYRNHSVLLGSNGGKLVDAPVGSTDAGALTDGWRHGAGRTWQAAAPVGGPVELTWELASPVTVSAVQIHQDPEWPSKDVEVLVSSDGATWTTVLAGEMPESSPAGPNFAFLFQRQLASPAKRVKVRILSGYRAERWGLGEVEVIGSGATMATDDDWYNVNVDLTRLERGATYHYRVVSQSSAGTIHGGDMTFTLPDGAVPEVRTGAASRIRGGTAKLEGRLNPLGRFTEYLFEYGEDLSYGQSTEIRYAGADVTPRTVVGMLSGLVPGATIHYRLVALTEAGVQRGADAAFVAQ